MGAMRALSGRGSARQGALQRALLRLAPALLVAACDPPSEPVEDGGPPPIEVELLPGSIELMRDDRPPAYSMGLGELEGRLEVLDGAADGARVAVLAVLAREMRDSLEAPRVLFLSEDGGASFARHDLPAMPGVVHGVHLAGPRTYLLAVGFGTSVVSFDPATGALGTPRELVASPFVFDGPIVAALQHRTEGSRGPIVEHGRLDGTRDEVTFSREGTEPESCEWRYESADARSWTRYCYTTSERCAHVIEPAVDPARITRRCVPASAWPVPQTVAQGPVPALGHVWMAHYAGGRSYLTRIVDEAARPPRAPPSISARASSSRSTIPSKGSRTRATAGSSRCGSSAARATASFASRPTHARTTSASRALLACVPPSASRAAGSKSGSRSSCPSPQAAGSPSTCSISGRRIDGSSCATPRTARRRPSRCRPICVSSRAGRASRCSASPTSSGCARG
jgi:hypothetical protein